MSSLRQLLGACPKCLDRLVNPHVRDVRQIRAFSSVITPDQREHDDDEDTIKSIGLSRGEQTKLRKLKPKQPPDPRSLKVAIMGVPNAGKSTLANSLAGWKFVPVSNKVHTTRKKSLGVLTEGNKQIVFLDTPGIVTSKKVKKHNLEMSLLVDPHNTLFEADLIAVVVDMSHVWHRGELDVEILKALHLHNHKKSVLVLNKVDVLTNKSDLLQAARMLTSGVVGGHRFWKFNAKTPDVVDLDAYLNKATNALRQPARREAGKHISSATATDGAGPGDDVVRHKGDVPQFTSQQLENLRSDWTEYHKTLNAIGRRLKDKKGWSGFDRVFMVSALHGDGVWDLKSYLLESTLPGAWRYHSAMVTDQDPLLLARQCVQEKLLDNLDKDIPYALKVEMVLWEEDDTNILRTAFDIVCPTSRHQRAVLGKHGSMVRKISVEAKQALMNVFKRDMSLKLRVVRTGETQM